MILSYLISFIIFPLIAIIYFISSIRYVVNILFFSMGTPFPKSIILYRQLIFYIISIILYFIFIVCYFLFFFIFTLIYIFTYHILQLLLLCMSLSYMISFARFLVIIIIYPIFLSDFYLYLLSHSGNSFSLNFSSSVSSVNFSLSFSLYRNLRHAQFISMIITFIFIITY